MKAISNAVLVPLLAAGLLLLATGCETVEKYSLTHRVWDNDDWCQFNQPMPNPNLALFEATNHACVLVLLMIDLYPGGSAASRGELNGWSPSAPRKGSVISFGNPLKLYV